MRCLRLWYFFSQWKFLSHSMYKTCTARKMQHEKRREEQIDAHKIAKCSSFISRLEKRKAQVKDVLLLRTRTSQQEMNCRNAKQDWRKERSKKPLFCFIDARARSRPLVWTFPLPRRVFPTRKNVIKCTEHFQHKDVNRIKWIQCYICMIKFLPLSPFNVAFTKHIHALSLESVCIPPMVAEHRIKKNGNIFCFFFHFPLAIFLPLLVRFSSIIMFEMI